MPLWRLGFLKALELLGKGLVELGGRAKRMLASYTIFLVSHAAELKDFGEAALRAVMLEGPSNFVQVLQGR